MKIPAVFLLLFTGALVLAAGCTSQQPAPQTTVPTTVGLVATIAPKPLATPITAATTAVPSALTHAWTLTLMAVRNGSAPVAPAGANITLQFLPDGTIEGNGGCNGYSADFSLNGIETAKGNGIAIGPVVSTKMFCNQVARQENTYFSILTNAATYDVDVDVLTITAGDGNRLVYQKSG